jgi:hypothetical protein
MDCERFERWLNEGMDAAAGAEVHAHAASCAGCGAALAAAHALDAALGQPAVVAPAGFAERVMERVARARAARRLTWIEPEVLPWWVRAAAEPVTALSLALAALVLWQYPALARFTVAAFQALASPAVATFVHQWSAPGSRPASPRSRTRSCSRAWSWRGCRSRGGPGSRSITGAATRRCCAPFGAEAAAGRRLTRR